MNKKDHLPTYGVGPIYVLIIALITALACGLSAGGLLDSGSISQLGWPALRVAFIIVGIILIFFGLELWRITVLKSDIDKAIAENRLITTGVYAHVRNPIYASFMSAFTGLLVCLGNLWLLVLPVVFYVFLTVLMICTEEKWLTNLYGEEYLAYCKQVNRCIPWFRKKHR